MYFVPLILLSVFSVMENRINDKKHFFYKIAFGILFLMLCFRYGQGTDYYGYMWNYLIEDNHSEAGYQFLQQLFLSWGFSYEMFVFVISAFEMLCIYRCIRIFGQQMSLSLLLLYPTVYLTYFFSTLRQGIVIAFFLGFMLKWIVDGKWIRYLLACIVMISIHSVSIILVPIIFVKFIKRKHLYCCVFIASLMGVAIYVIPQSWFSFINIGSFQYYLNNFSVSYIGLMERIVMQFIVILLWVSAKVNLKENVSIEIMYKIYLCGFMISVIFFPWSMVSSRLAAALKAIEIVLIPMLLKRSEKWRQIVLTAILCYAFIMTTKNLNSYIFQGGYEGFNVITYPYISVFNKEKAEMVRNIPYDFE